MIQWETKSNNLTNEKRLKAKSSLRRPPTPPPPPPPPRAIAAAKRAERRWTVVERYRKLAQAVESPRVHLPQQSTISPPRLESHLFPSEGWGWWQAKEARQEGWRRRNTSGLHPHSGLFPLLVVAARGRKPDEGVTRLWLRWTGCRQPRPSYSARANPACAFY